MLDSAWIFARGGSVRVPGKNLSSAGGKPLLGWAIEHAQGTALFERVFVSTDSPEIAGIAREFGAEVPFMRPDFLSQSGSEELGAWRHAIEWEHKETGRLPQLFVSVPTTAPLREPSDIAACVAALSEGGADLVMTVTRAKTLPGYNMVAMGESSSLRLLGAGSSPEAPPARSSIFNVTTVCYAARPEYVLQAANLFSGKVLGSVVPEERALDIDTYFDLRVADLVLKDRLLKMEGDFDVQR